MTDPVNYSKLYPFPFLDLGRAIEMNLLLSRAEEEAQKKRNKAMQDRIDSLAVLVFPDKKPRLKLNRQCKYWTCSGTQCGKQIYTQAATKEQAYAFYVEKATAATKGKYFAQAKS